jgi:hypothetical protein
MNEA